jgi:hypothetical protein
MLFHRGWTLTVLMDDAFQPILDSLRPKRRSKLEWFFRER